MANMTSQDKFKLALAVALLLLAVGVFYLLSPGKGAMVFAPEARTLWYCTACKSGFELSGEQTAAMVRLTHKVDGLPSDGVAATPRRPGRTVIEITKCPFCAELAAVPARRCPVCGEMFALRTKTGEIAVCPNCEWNPTQDKKAEGRRAGQRG